MREQQAKANDANAPGIYEIRLKGHLAERWKDRLGGLSISLEEGGETVLTGAIADQPELYGLLKKIRDLGLPLLSVIRIESSPAESSSAARQASCQPR